MESRSFPDYQLAILQPQKRNKISNNESDDWITKSKVHDSKQAIEQRRPNVNSQIDFNSVTVHRSFIPLICFLLLGPFSYRKTFSPRVQIVALEASKGADLDYWLNKLCVKSLWDKLHFRLGRPASTERNTPWEPTIATARRRRSNGAQQQYFG